MYIYITKQVMNCFDHHVRIFVRECCVCESYLLISHAFNDIDDNTKEYIRVKKEAHSIQLT